MSQTLHIFKKDTRRFRVEIAVSLLLQLLFVVHVPAQWTGRPQMAVEAFQFIMILLPLSWCLLIARVVHGETLVGDRQFWITRPYTWTQLLSAKALFLVMWIAAPYLIAQFVILHSAGFAAHLYIGSSFFNLLLIAGMLLLPLVALATITDNFARFTLTLLGGIVALVTLAICVNSLALRSYSAWNPLQDHISFPLELAASVLVIVLQYATRRVWVARAIAVAAALILFSITVLYRSQALIDRAYAGSVHAPMQVAMAPGKLVTAWGPAGFIRVPLQYSGVPEGYAVQMLNARFTIIAADGTTWTSGWQVDTYRDPVVSATRYENLTLKMDAATLARFRRAPVTMRLTLAGDVLRSDDSFIVPYPHGSGEVPGLGICSTRPNNPTLQCRDVVRQDMFLSAIKAEGQCFRGRTMWLGHIGTNLAAELSPVETYVNFMLWSKNDPCYSSNMIVSPYHFQNRATTEITVSNVNLANDAPADAGSD
jgi:hypothetical protein